MDLFYTFEKTFTYQERRPVIVAPSDRRLLPTRAAATAAAHKLHY